jgi:hypothetical protein
MVCVIQISSTHASLVGDIYNNYAILLLNPIVEQTGQPVIVCPVILLLALVQWCLPVTSTNKISDVQFGCPVIIMLALVLALYKV